MGDFSEDPMVDPNCPHGGAETNSQTLSESHENSTDSPDFLSDSETYQNLEEQYELLNCSLIALTTHFAQVQFRLRQIVEAPQNEKEVLLKSLEEFAFRGVPELESNILRKRLTPDIQSLEDALNLQRAKQTELIEKLKSQLAELEAYAYEAGEGGLPETVILERQKVIIDQIKGQLKLNVDDFDKMSIDELKDYVNNAVGEIINPLKMKEQLVLQLKTQISDLERFIHFLQVDAKTYSKKGCKCNCKCDSCNHNLNTSQEQLQGKVLTTMKRISALLNMFATTQFHITKKFQRNSPKRHKKIKHWGDTRAHLELAIGNIIELAKAPAECYPDSDYVSDSESIIHSPSKLTTMVRKHLAVSLQNLIQHGLVGPGNSLSLVPFVGCFRQRDDEEENEIHAWLLILKYYDMKNGEKFNATPARRLSQSFNLDITGSKNCSAKQSLLSTVGNIIHSHDIYKKGYDARFKAFVSAGLNTKMLVAWLKLILRCQPILELYYADWSYVVKTGFEDAFNSLERLNQFTFNLPVDYAVRKLNEIKDAF